MAWRDTLEKLKQLPQQALALLRKADETELHAKIERFHQEILRQIDRYIEGKEALDAAPSGKAKGMKGNDLRQIGKRLRAEVREAVSLLKQVKNKRYLKEADEWREKVQKLLDQLDQDIDIRRASIAERVAARYRVSQEVRGLSA
jgi:hypothetical protein